MVGDENQIDDYEMEYEGEYIVPQEDKYKSNGVYFMLQNELIKDRETIIAEAMENLYLTKDEATIVLISYNWSMDKLLSVWYDNVDNNMITCGLVLSEEAKKQLLKENVLSNSNECLVCFDDDTENLVSLSCGHKFCKDCWEGYLKEKVEDILTTLTTTCPQKGCPLIVYESFFNRFLNDPTLKGKFYKAIIKNFTANNDDIKLCPNPKCSISVKCFEHIGDIECSCGYSFCFKCYKEGHRPCSCYMVSQWEKNQKDESANDIWVKANTKLCPHCKQRIERSHGCNYMLCDKKAGGCGKAFCYVCEIDWANHSQDHFKCNHYTTEVKTKEANANLLKEKLKRYAFYFDRYINYRQAVKIAKEKLFPVLEDKIGLFISLKNISLSEFQFILDGFNAVLKGKTSLKNTYIFGYYMKDDDAKKLFEYQQALLERNADQLHQMLEQNMINDILEIDNFMEFDKAFTEFRSNVTNFTSVILKYKDNLLQSIENDLSSHIDQNILEHIFEV